MAAFSFQNAQVLLNAVDLSDHVKKATIKTSAKDLDSTAMGATYQARLGGLKDWSLDIEFNEDFAAANVDATMFPLLGTVFAAEIRPVNGARSATNPGYNGNVLLTDYVPMDGQVGELAKAVVSFKGAGALFRSTS